jgi:hypothetical protein
MITLRDPTLRLRALLWRRRSERNLHDELSFHAEREARNLIDHGVSPEKARSPRTPRFVCKSSSTGSPGCARGWQPRSDRGRISPAPIG